MNMKRLSFSRTVRLFTLMLCIALLSGMLTGCAAVSRENLLFAALGPTATSFFPNSVQVQADTSGASLPCYYDGNSGTYYYVCEDLNKVSTTEYAYTLRTFYYQNGILRTRILATRSVLYYGSGQTYTT